MIALLIAITVHAAPALSEDDRPTVRVEGQDPDDKETCHVDLLSLKVFNSNLRSACVAEGILVNRAPFEIGDVSIVVTLFENGVILSSLPRAGWNRLEPRKARKFTIEGTLLQGIPRFTTRTKVTYRIQGVERVFEFDGLKRRFGKLYADAGTETRFGLSGLLIVEGKYRKRGKSFDYTGDTVFVRLWVEALDPKKRPTGTVKITLRYDGKKIGSLKRSIRSSHWKLDARRLPAADADPKIICFDAETGELLVGICRLKEDSEPDKLGMDVEFTWRKKTWTWSGLESPFVEAPRPPDGK